MNRSRPIIGITLLMLFIASSVLAQGLTGSLTGVVTQDGTPIPGVTVTITSPQMQGTRSAVTNDAGGYNFGAIPPGDYKVRFELTGMQPVIKPIHVGVSQNATADASMKVSTVTEAITVTASAPAVAETNEIQANFTNKTIQTLPVARNLNSIVSLAPGVNTGGVNGATISGGASYDNLYMTDGAIIQENLRGQPHNLFIEDAIQETTVQTAGISAEFGNFTGGVINAITKSGGNDFSGSFRDNATNSKWTSKSPNSFALASGVVTEVPTPTPKSHIDNAYEGTLGGRIIRDRLWFFGAGRFSKRNFTSLFTNAMGQYPRTTKDEREEGKLTGAVTSKHNLVVSFINAPASGTNGCQIGCYDASAIYPTYSNPNSFLTTFYNGVLTDSLLVEGKFTRKVFQFVNYGGTDFDRVTGTPIRLVAPGYATVTNESFFCGACDPENRNNKQYGAKVNYYFGSKSVGNHNLVAGIDRWHETRLSNNYQSTTNYVFIATGYAPGRDANFNPLVNIKGGTDYFQYWPVLFPSQGSNLDTDSLYANDKWSLNSHVEFNIGGRYDKNNATDSAGNKVANDSKFSPRLGANYDVWGNGRLRFNTSYAVYVGRLAETVAGSESAAGSPARFNHLYGGPDILNAAPADALRQVWAWFDAQGGIDKTPIMSQNIPGASTVIQGSLKSPNVREYTIGASTQFGRNAYVRGDVIRRAYRDFYGLIANQSTGKITLPNGSKADLTYVTNINDLKRTYNGIDMQAGTRLGRLDVGANYTYSQLKGNTVGETSGSGPVAEGASQYYPEYYGFAQNSPTGYLTGDERHKLRAWAGYDVPTPAGNFNFSVLERLDSGARYSLAGTINVAYSANFYGTGLAGGVQNPGYVTAPTSETYYFSKRGAYSLPTVTATDFSINYNISPAWFRGAGLFAQAQIVNILNQHELVGMNTAIVTAYNDSTLKRFNPFAGDVPVEGVNWKKGPLFGKPTSPTSADTAGSFQLPRTYRFNVGVRF